MHLNYDSYYLIRDQVKTDLFLIYTCRDFYTPLKKKYTIGMKGKTRHHCGKGCHLCHRWVGKNKNIEEYITTLVKKMYEFNKEGFSRGYFWVCRGDYFFFSIGCIEICRI